jgi:hypothetical protein
MSTKTTFKRIALVAVTALGLGVLTSIAPASAAIQSDTLTLSATTGTAAIGETATVTVSLSALDTDASAETFTATAAILSSPATSTVFPTFSVTTAQGTANTAGTTAGSAQTMTLTSTAAGRVSGAATLSLVNLAVAGTYVVRVTPSLGLTTTAQTWTVTVAAKPTLTAAASTVYQGYDYYGDAADIAIRGAWAAPSSVTDATKLLCYAYPGYSCARIKVTQSNGSTTNPLVSTDAVAITATVTGPGLVEINSIYPNYTTQPKGTYAVETAGQNTAYGLEKYVYVWSTGVPGAVSVVIKAGDIVLGTKTMTFYEAAKTYTAAVGTGFAGSAYPVAPSAAAINVTAKDPSGYLVPGTTVYAFSSDATIATVSASVVGSAAGVSAFTLTGVKAGSTTISFGNASTLALSTVTTTQAVTVTGSTATTVTLTLDKADYAPGEKMTLTITAKDSNGKPVADGPRAVIASPTSNVALGGTVSATTTLLGGVATQTLYAPATSGSFTISATEGGDTASTTKATLTVSATVTNAGADVAQAAADAAAEATDAANAATDAANAAAEAADAATAAAQDAADAVAALSVQVSEQIAELKAQNDALRKQLIALTNLIIKIQKKVKA